MVEEEEKKEREFFHFFFFRGRGCEKNGNFFSPPPYRYSKRPCASGLAERPGIRPAVRPWTARAGRGSCAAAAAKEDSTAAVSAARRVGLVGVADVVVVVVGRGVVDRREEDVEEQGASAALFASCPLACAAAAHIVLARGRAAKVAAECIGESERKVCSSLFSLSDRF